MTPSRPRVLLLFDIDGTLLVTGGVAREAFSCAVRDVFHIEDDLTGVEFAGRTEPLIVADILAKRGLSFRDGDEPRFWDALVHHMGRLFLPPKGRLLPGVAELLAALDVRPDHARALLTGNLSRVARIKLARFGIAERFPWGTFGEEAPDRDGLARLAVRRGEERLGVPAARTIVVGDTHRDIACARAAGAHVVAVATGSMNVDQLAAHGPDLLLSDLADPAPLLDFAARIAAGA